jgi:DNA primase
MGTALTENQLRELSRLTNRLYLCFDADAAGQEATLRGMELATRRGLEVYVVPLPPGSDPADHPGAFQERLASPHPYALHRVELELERMEDRQHAYLRIQEFLNGLPESPERQEAWRLANDRLGLTVQLRAGVSSTSVSTGPVSPKLLEAGMRLERDALAACVAHPELIEVLGELGPDHFDDPLHRRLRDHLVQPGDVEPELLRLLAELDARAEAEGIDVETGKQLLLRLRERGLERELAEADLEDTKELQAALARVREAVREFA